MTVLRATALTALLIASALATPSLARPNDGRFKQSSEAVKQQQVDCAFYKNMLEIAERDAADNAGTKAARKYAKEADKWWGKGASAGCAWAA